MLEEQQTLTNTEAAGELGVSAEWLRFGERLRAFPPAPLSRNGWRYYPREDIDRLYQLGVDVGKRWLLETR